MFDRALNKLRTTKHEKQAKCLSEFKTLLSKISLSLLEK